jgi:hypothetical protein
VTPSKLDLIQTPWEAMIGEAPGLMGCLYTWSGTLAGDANTSFSHDNIGSPMSDGNAHIGVSWPICLILVDGWEPDKTL